MLACARITVLLCLSVPLHAANPNAEIAAARHEHDDESRMAVQGLVKQLGGHHHQHTKGSKPMVPAQWKEQMAKEAEQKEHDREAAEKSAAEALSVKKEKESATLRKQQDVKVKTKLQKDLTDVRKAAGADVVTAKADGAKKINITEVLADQAIDAAALRDNKTQTHRKQMTAAEAAEKKEQEREAASKVAQAAEALAKHAEEEKAAKAKKEQLTDKVKAVEQSINGTRSNPMKKIADIKNEVEQAEKIVDNTKAQLKLGAKDKLAKDMEKKDVEDALKEREEQVDNMFGHLHSEAVSAEEKKAAQDSKKWETGVQHKGPSPLEVETSVKRVDEVVAHLHNTEQQTHLKEVAKKVETDNEQSAKELKDVQKEIHSMKVPSMPKEASIVDARPRKMFRPDTHREQKNKAAQSEKLAVSGDLDRENKVRQGSQDLVAQMQAAQNQIRHDLKD